ncbi:aconitase X, partial [Methanomethylovorans sp.]|uniref:aconitase X n=1 Tax=Methanomethylovorans sp. TaxID=2758717 RepID=UPI002FDECC70
TIGCPHCSPAELSLIAGLLEGRTVNKEVWICTSREVANKHPELVRSIEKSGAKVVCDTCMVVSPATEKYKTMMVNSGKALAYVPGMCGVPTLFGDIYKCIREAVKE